MMIQFNIGINVKTFHSVFIKLYCIMDLNAFESNLFGKFE